MQTQRTQFPSKDGIYFSVSTAQVIDNRQLRAAIKDTDGYYTDFPAAVLGVVSRNKTRYDPQAFIEQIRSTDSGFNKRLREGVLAGEVSHPHVDMNSESGMRRLMNIDLQKQSHHIRKVSVKRIDDIGLDVVTVDVKGAGPYGYVFEEGMADPTRNVAFSLRGLSKATVDRSSGVIDKKLISLTTFDMVAGGGFDIASKRYMSFAQEQLNAHRSEDIYCESCELLEHQVSPEDLLVIRSFAVESFSETELNEILKAHRVLVGTVEVGYIDRNKQTVFDCETGAKRSLFHSFMKIKR